MAQFIIWLHLSSIISSCQPIYNVVNGYEKNLPNFCGSSLMDRIFIIDNTLSLITIHLLLSIQELDSRAVSSGLIPLFSPLIIRMFLIKNFQIRFPMAFRTCLRLRQHLKNSNETFQIEVVCHIKTVRTHALPYNKYL
ncbi:hypothetical protein BpHYR1_029663 [Brachionus plicatilis]|uniref:Uncharacterized protein n=1 Tax=Brachionus plicatilis TaxID=10195 RepID=A0A3M7QYB6_BRAPC|nr:hypothetical protein BpHYR1_029663 [Brachionus plicatilis]